MKKIAFLINPIAGMGGKVGLKGTDKVYEKAIQLGAKPVAQERAKQMLNTLQQYNDKDLFWITCAGTMGENALKKSGYQKIEVVYSPQNDSTTSVDTKEACKQYIKKKVDLIVFCGGDGTARDVYSAIGKKIPILGIPSGVKMHSGVFGVTAEAAAKILHEFLNRDLAIGDVEIMDLDEDRYRKGEWNIKLFGIAHGIVEPTYIQVGKSMFESVSEESIKEEIAEHIEQIMDEHQKTLFLMGSGGTIDSIAHSIGLENTLLGIDAVYKGKTIQKDLNEKKILDLLTKYRSVKLILSPIGAQGFILGRGNLQLTPGILSKIGINDIIIVSTPTKLKHTPVLRVDTGDHKLDEKFHQKEYLLVVIGYQLSRVVKIASE